MDTFLQPTALMPQHRTYSSIQTYMVLMSYLVLVKGLLIFFPQVFRSPTQAAVFEWKFIGLWTLAGLIGVTLSVRTGFPPLWNAAIPKTRRLLFPILLGVGFGVIAVATDVLTGWTDIVARKMGLTSIHIDWPASLIIYPGGAIIVDVIYRLLPIPLLLWLVSNLVLRGRGQVATFWMIAALTSFLEPWGDLGLWKHGAAMTTAVFAQDYALNLTQAYLFRRSGFVSSVMLRIAFYMIWHVAYGLLGG